MVVRIYRWLYGAGLIHILLVAATVVVVIRVIQGRRPLQRFGLVNLLRKEMLQMKKVLLIVMLIIAIGSVGCPRRNYDRDRRDQDRGHDYEHRDRDNHDREQDREHRR